MGIVSKLIHDELINSQSDRGSNLLRVYRKDNGEVVIHFRNLKIVLITPEEIEEWKTGFTQALKTLQERDLFRNDI